MASSSAWLWRRGHLRAVALPALERPAVERRRVVLRRFQQPEGHDPAVAVAAHSQQLRHRFKADQSNSARTCRLSAPWPTQSPSATRVKTQKSVLVYFCFWADSRHWMRWAIRQGLTDSVEKTLFSISARNIDSLSSVRGSQRFKMTLAPDRILRSQAISRTFSTESTRRRHRNIVVGTATPGSRCRLLFQVNPL
jgi:hypothetical protein